MSCYHDPLVIVIKPKYFICYLCCYFALF